MITILNLFLTILIEFVIVWLFFRKEILKILGFIILINLFSWPIANLIYGVYNNLFVIEIGVILVESILIMLLFRTKYWKALLISLVANSISALVGFFFSQL